VPYNYDVIKNHLLGHIKNSSGNSKPFIAGIYPLLEDETCRFLAIDFDKDSWIQDTNAFLDTCAEIMVPAYRERSRSGNGAHIWIFFSTPIKAKTARNFGASLITKTLDRRPEIGLDSFDRFFPNQDTMPHGGFGNLIALPLQKEARNKNHSVFIDENLEPYSDQWLFLSSIKRINLNTIETHLMDAQKNGEILPIYPSNENSQEQLLPWIQNNSKSPFPVISSPLPKCIDIIVSNQILVSTSGLPATLRNRILRLASFSNPEFYKAQAMRLPTWNKPRILYCYEQISNQIGIPIGCYDDLLQLLNHYKIKPVITENRTKGKLLELEFKGTLFDEQELAANALLNHSNGILSATTSFGKTVVGLWLIAQRKVSTLILVHRKHLMEQWVERMVQFFGISKKDIGKIGGGRKKRNGLIDVAVIQSVYKDKEVEPWVNDYGQIIVDECHHISAFSFEQVIRSCQAYYKVGLSATLTRKDGQHPIVFMNLGPIRYSVNAKKHASQRGFTHKVITHNTSFQVTNAESASQNIQELFGKLWNNEPRNEMIVDNICESIANRRQILVLSERKDHLEIFEEKLENHCSNIFTLKGGIGKKQFKEIMENIESLDSDQSLIILATGKYLGEGFDLPRLDTLFMTFPISWKGTISQYAGRLHREYFTKSEVIIHDYIDHHIPVLIKMFDKRQKGYKALGYEISHVD
jgi:superfamily II DNA or RNA helicase